jgi:hypothetical protein
MARTSPQYWPCAPQTSCCHHLCRPHNPTKNHSRVHTSALQKPNRAYLWCSGPTSQPAAQNQLTCIWHTHFHNAGPVHHRPPAATICVAHTVQHKTLSPIEAQAQVPLLPGHMPAINSEAGALHWKTGGDGLQVVRYLGSSALCLVKGGGGVHPIRRHNSSSGPLLPGHKPAIKSEARPCVDGLK